MGTTQPDIAQAALKRQQLGRVYFAPVGAVYEVDMGNLADWKTQNTEDTVTHKASEYGVLRDDMELVVGIGWGFSFTFDEFTDQAVALVQKTAGSTAFTQGSATSSTASISSSLKGKTYNLGKYNVSNVVVTVSAATKVLDVDYALNAAGGRITILQGGSITDASAVTVTFDVAAVAMRQFGSGDKPTIQGGFTLHEYDQMSSTVRAVWTWQGSMRLKDITSGAGKDFDKMEVAVKCWTKPVRLER